MENKEDLFRDVMFIIILASVIGFAVNAFHPKGFRFMSTSLLKNRSIVMISSEEAKIKYDSSSTVFIDSRTVDEYRTSHIAGAVNIPAYPESIRAKTIKDNFSLIKGPREMVVYCTGSSCGTSEILVREFLNMGYDRKIYIIENGLPEWEAEGYPVVGEELEE